MEAITMLPTNDQIEASRRYVITNPEFTMPENLIQFMTHGNTEVVRIGPEGRIYWNSREVESDDDFRAAMLDVAAALRGAR